VSVTAVVVNYRTAEATTAAVRQLLADLEPVAGSVVVVDNDSRDGSAEALRRAFDEPPFRGRVRFIDAGHNGGYGYGINVGVRAALEAPTPPRYVHVLNPDATADAGSLASLLAFMDAHPDAGMVGSLIHGEDGRVQARSFRFLSIWSEFEGTARFGPISRLLRRHIVSIEVDATMEADWISGTSMLIRAEVFQRGCWFDEGFFLYYEEIDFARRMRDAGWNIYYVAGAPITHVGSLSTGMLDLSRPMPRYWFESRRRYFVKHHGPAYATAVDVAWLCGYAILRAKLKVLGKPSPFRRRIARDLARFSLEQLGRPAPEAEQNRGGREPGTTRPRPTA
jgi:GT2 family glycosyltransferase